MGPILTNRSAMLQIEKTMQYKAVAPHSAFCNGQKLDIEGISVVSIADNLVDTVSFKYTLVDRNGSFAGDGVCSLGPDTYTLWDASAAGAYRLVCETIGLELLDA